MHPLEKRMINTIAALLFAVLASASYAQDLAPGSTMHRTQAGALDSAGLTFAESTNGRFSVQMPCTFNDFSILEKDESKPVKNIYALGCRRPDQRRFVAMRYEYRTEDDAQNYFRNFPKNSPWRDGKIVESTFKGMPAVTITIEDRKQCAFARTLRGKHDNLSMIVTAPETSCAGLAAMSQQFFESLDVTSW